MSFSGFWKAIGKGLAVTAKGVAKGALWASQHPEVIQVIETIAKLPPAVDQGINVGVGVVNSVEAPKS